jgi:hypothetical protein
MDNVTRLLMQGAAGAGGDGEFIDNLFETRLWDGTSGSRTITNGIDLSGEGGLVWIKRRTGSSENSGLFDTVRGAGKWLVSNSTAAESTDMNRVSAFNNNGFSLGSDNMVNNSSHSYLGFTFRKQKKFFDIVTYTGTGSARTVAHNLGSVPGAIIVRKVSGTAWAVYHRGVNGGTNPEQYQTELNGAAASYTDAGIWNNTAPTSTHFTVNTAGETNSNGAEYIAYLFAHDEAVFGLEGNNSVIKCGYYTGNGSSSNGPDINLGWEPQWLLVRRTNSNEDWMIFDHMRTSDRQGMYLDDYRPNNSNAEGDGAGGDSQPYLNWTSTGFKLSSNTGHTNGSGDNYIYIAIRRPDGVVGKPPEAGTDVFAMDTGNGSSDGPAFDSGFPVDMGFRRKPASGNSGTPDTDWATYSRLIGGVFLRANETNVEQNSNRAKFDLMTGFNHTDDSSYQAWMWKRHAGFDVVTYDGNSTPGRTVQHNLGKIPEMIWIKCRNTPESWVVGHKGLNGGTNPWEYSLRLNDTLTQYDYPYFNDTAPTSTLFTLNNNGQVNGTGTNDYVAFLFASVEGISKVGYYAGNSSGQTITTGFQPRFVIIKGIDYGASWYVLDTVRGWGAGNDQSLEINTTQAQNTGDFGAPTSTGFTLTGHNVYNGTGYNYIYYAHA